MFVSRVPFPLLLAGQLVPSLSPAPGTLGNSPCFPAWGLRGCVGGREGGRALGSRETTLFSLPAYDSWCGVAHGCTRKIGLKICGKSARATRFTRRCAVRPVSVAAGGPAAPGQRRPRPPPAGRTVAPLRGPGRDPPAAVPSPGLVEALSAAEGLASPPLPQ